MERPNDDLRATAGVKSDADKSLLRKIETAKFVYWVASLLVVGIVAVTIWVEGIQNNQVDMRKEINRNRFDIDAIKPRVDEMWWMKEAGITNADVKRSQAPHSAPDKP